MENETTVDNSPQSRMQTVHPAGISDSPFLILTRILIHDLHIIELHA